LRFATVKTKQGQRAMLVRDGELIDIHQADPNLPAKLSSIIKQFDRHRSALQGLVSKETIPAEQAEYLPPVPRPDKIICIGLNYADHAAETGSSVPDLPVVFNKFSGTLIGHRQQINLPPISQQVDYEAELVVVIGRKAKNVRREDAMQCVFGYMCGHDVSARDWQKGKPGGQWLLGKTFDTFAPCGPFLITADEIPEPDNLNIRLQLNGKTMQDSNTSNFIFSIDHLISHLSQFSTLLPGDLIFTGTPPGVGVARKPPVFLQHGDVVEIEIEKIGKLVNSVTDGR
jgi:2-keto-4-pentenoate hydratase/2-oxohepta-3-ene-1,7-dioic acid hydratase in catechol pathway